MNRWCTCDLRLTSRSSYLSLIYQFYYLTTIQFRTQACATHLKDECRVGTPILWSLVRSIILVLMLMHLINIYGAGLGHHCSDASCYDFQELLSYLLGTCVVLGTRWILGRKPRGWNRCIDKLGCWTSLFLFRDT